MAIYTGVTAVDPELGAAVWLMPLWQLAAFVLMAGVTRFKRWAGLGYILLTAAGLAVRFAAPEKTALWDAATFIFPVDVIAASLVLFFYKRLT
jgi:hypothetical protein